VTTAAVVLAAGGGTRFAGRTHKLLADFRGRPLWTWSVDAAITAGLDDVIVVMGALTLAPLAAGVRVVHNDAWADGQATSVQTAIHAAGAAGHDAIVVGLADQPLVVPSAWRAVAAVRDPDHPIAVATYGGVRGNPVRLSADVWSLMPNSGDAGARVLMAERPALVVEVACDGDPADVDTVEDLSRWS
jgi:CTP:molybdopterin cytidylyltransferase MocA